MFCFCFHSAVSVQCWVNESSIGTTGDYRSIVYFIICWLKHYIHVHWRLTEKEIDIGKISLEWSWQMLEPTYYKIDYTLV